MTSYIFTAIVTLFVTVDPVGLAPDVRRHDARHGAGAPPSGRLPRYAHRDRGAGRVRAVRPAALTFLGISLAAFRISGGLLLFWIAFEMVFERRDQRKSAAVESARAITSDEISHMAVVPLAIPRSPARARSRPPSSCRRRREDYVWLGILILVIAAVMGVVVVVFETAGQIDRFLGTTGRAITSRLLGVILARCRYSSSPTASCSLPAARPRRVVSIGAGGGGLTALARPQCLVVLPARTGSRRPVPRRAWRPPCGPPCAVAAAVAFHGRRAAEIRSRCRR